MRRELVNGKREGRTEAEAEAEIHEKADIDSVICACGIPMLMRFSHAHES